VHVCLPRLSFQRNCGRRVCKRESKWVCSIIRVQNKFSLFNGTRMPSRRFILRTLNCPLQKIIPTESKRERQSCRMNVWERRLSRLQIMRAVERAMQCAPLSLGVHLNLYRPGISADWHLIWRLPTSRVSRTLPLTHSAPQLGVNSAPVPPAAIATNR